MAQIHPALLDDGFMHLLAMPSCPRLPAPHRALIQTKGGDYRLEWAPMAEQDEHERDQVGGRA
jgi:hypothetical protein